MEVGCLHPDFLVEQLSFEQIAGWRRQFQRRPFGSHREDLRLLVLLKYLQSSQGGEGGAFPSPLYPYFADDEELQELADQFFQDEEE